MKKPFRLYRNLHKGNFSIQEYVKEKSGYRVSDRVSECILTNVQFIVYQSGRDKVLRERSKNVHAFVTAEEYNVAFKLSNDCKLREIYYNPYKYNSFVYKDNEEKLEGVKLEKVLMKNNKIYQIYEP